MNMADHGQASSSRAPLVLIVEDDPETRQFYAHALEQHGFRTEQAHNGRQALEKAREDAPDLVLADIALPGMDGIELCRELRADVRTRTIRVIAITGYGDRHYPDRARGAGADQVLTKPCDAETLVAEARRLLAVGVPTRNQNG
jgi:two-component system, cell cycle response regulator DivK